MKNEFPAAVKIEEAACSGVMISPIHVLTAGHCVQSSPVGYIFPENFVSISLVNVPDLSGWPLSFRNEIVSRKMHPLWIDRLLEMGNPDSVADMHDTSDIGIYELKYSLPILFAVMPTAAPVESKEYTAASSGCLEHGGSSVVTLRVGRMILESIEKGRLILSGHSNETPGVGVCSGDSGGGLYFFNGSDYERDKEYRQILYGVASTTPTAEPDFSTTGLSVYAYLTHLIHGIPLRLVSLPASAFSWQLVDFMVLGC